MKSYERLMRIRIVPKMTRMFPKKTSAHGLSRIRCAQVEDYEKIIKLKRWDNWDNIGYNSNTTLGIFI